jgi:S-adenosylmethionine-dependent methyltransferase
VVGDDTWARLADQFADEAYASVKGHLRTYVLHQQLLEHLPPPPAPVLDVGGGAGHQSFPLAQAGYDVTLLDPSQAMLDKAQQRRQRLPAEARRRVTLVQADGENADEAVDGRRFAADALIHGQPKWCSWGGCLFEDQPIEEGAALLRVVIGPTLSG